MFWKYYRGGGGVIEEYGLTLHESDNMHFFSGSKQCNIPYPTGKQFKYKIYLLNAIHVFIVRNKISKNYFNLFSVLHGELMSLCNIFEDL